MRHYYSSIVIMGLFGAILMWTALQLNQFNDDLVLSMFQTPARTVAGVQ